MDEPQAFFCGQWMPASQLSIPIYDAGFVLGATVTEQLRTFGGELFRLEDHLERLFGSLQIAGIEASLERDELADIAQQVVARNHPLLAPGDDLGVGIFATPGPYPTLAGGVEAGPTVCVHSYPLPFHLWSEQYDRGQAILVSDVIQVPPACWPPELKCRSRMHYYLADQRARAVDPKARAILLDDRGFVSEGSTANVVLCCESDGLVSPHRERILPGISLKVLVELAATLSIPFVERDIRPEDLQSSQEVFLSSTSVCLLPVVTCDGQRVGDGAPGKIFRQLMKAWGDLVGFDIVQQAAHFARRSSSQ